MTMFALFQTAVLGILLLGCGLGVTRKLAPGVWQAVFAALSRALARRGHAGIARRMEPSITPAGGCGSGCSACSGCALKTRVDSARRAPPTTEHGL